MQFRVLGSLEVIDGARRVDLGGHKQRTVLAALLVFANRVVTVDRLVDELWGDSPPRQATASLQAYISNLRRLLDLGRAPREPSRLLRSEGGGYLLDVDLADVDYAVFEQRAAEGRTLLRQGRAEAAHETLASALALWRGPAFADFADAPFAGAEGARLEELRGGVVEDRLAAQLALGEHVAVVAELHRLVAENPLRERLWELLVLALYRCGRRGDALAAYQRCRRTLAEELGIDPSPALRNLEGAVLQQDPSLDWSPPEDGPEPADAPGRRDPAVVEPIRRPSNLPVHLSSFIGREAERAEMSALLRTARLVTLTGAGGAGKTRLATELARGLADELSGGASMVDLAPIFEPGLVLKSFAHALGVPERPTSALLDDVVARLRELETLVVLDNCEHLSDECARLAGELLGACPGLRILATSREPLGVPGEIVRRLGSLDGDEAVRLLAERAAAALPGFELTAATTPIAERICSRLDGLPLAIELAAARIATLSLHDLAAHLEDCFALLTGGARTALPRQRTLEAAVAWSYDLLTESQRLVFDRMSVFAGGCTLEAAMRVCSLGDLDQREVIDAISALVQKSLVARDELPDGRARYRLLETLRQYARNRLAERGEADRARGEHVVWARDLCQTTEPLLDTLDQAAALDVLAAELDNMRSAVEWTLAAGHAASGLQIMSSATGSFWLWRGHSVEAQRIVDRLLAAPADVPGAVRARGLLTGGRLRFQNGDWDDGARFCRESVQLAQACGDARVEAQALVYLAMNAMGLDVGHEDIVKLLDQGMAAARRSGGPLERALMASIAGMWWADVDGARARELSDEAGAVIARSPSHNWLAHVSEMRAYVVFTHGEPARARTMMGEALALYLQMSNHACGAHCLDSAALLVAAMERPETAAELLAAADRLRESIGTSPPPYEFKVRDRAVGLVDAALSPAQRESARERGRALSFEAAIKRASTATAGRD